MINLSVCVCVFLGSDLTTAGLLLSSMKSLSCLCACCVTQFVFQGKLNISFPFEATLEVVIMHHHWYLWQMWWFLLSWQKDSVYFTTVRSKSDCEGVALSYFSVWGDGVAAGAAGVFVQSCAFGWSWLGSDFGRREHFPLVLHRLRPRSSSSPFCSTVPTDGACSSFILRLLLTSYRLYLPYFPLFIAEA